MKDELIEYLIKIANFGKAILLDKDNIPSESLALTMAEEIVSYSTKALEQLEQAKMCLGFYNLGTSFFLTTDLTNVILEVTKVNTT